MDLETQKNVTFQCIESFRVPINPTSLPGNLLCSKKCKCMWTLHAVCKDFIMLTRLGVFGGWGMKRKTTVNSGCE